VIEYPTMNANGLQLLNKVISYNIANTDIFEKVLDLYNPYFDVGCDYLINNTVIVRSFLERVTLQVYSPPIRTKNNFLVDYALKHPERLKMLSKVLQNFEGYHFILLDMLIGLSDQLIPLLKSVSESINTPSTHPVLMKCPVINCFGDLTDSTITQLSSWVKAHPFDDKIFFLGSNPSAEKSYISGSKGLLIFYNTLFEFYKSVGVDIPKKNIGSNDTDIFFVGAKNVSRVKMDTIDLIYTRLESIQEVLLNFDLPCCRVAVDSNNNFYVSAQCLVSLILNDPVIMPEYVKKVGPLSRKYQEAGCRISDINDHISKIVMRFKKYQLRGFVFTYVKTEEVMNFIKNVEMYSESRMNNTIKQ